MSELSSAAVTTLCGWRMRHTPTVGQVLVQRCEFESQAKVGATVNNERQWDGQRVGAGVVLPQGLGQQLLHHHGVDRRVVCFTFSTRLLREGGSVGQCVSSEAM